jgi:hypothetical protein
MGIPVKNSQGCRGQSRTRCYGGPSPGPNGGHEHLTRRGRWLSWESPRGGTLLLPSPLSCWSVLWHSVSITQGVAGWAKRSSVHGFIPGPNLNYSRAQVRRLFRHFPADASTTRSTKVDSFVALLAPPGSVIRETQRLPRRAKRSNRGCAPWLTSGPRTLVPDARNWVEHRNGPKRWTSWSDLWRISPSEAWFLSLFFFLYRGLRPLVPLRRCRAHNWVCHVALSAPEFFPNPLGALLWSCPCLQRDLAAGTSGATAIRPGRPTAPAVGSRTSIWDLAI